MFILSYLGIGTENTRDVIEYCLFLIFFLRCMIFFYVCLILILNLIPFEKTVWLIGLFAIRIWLKKR